MQLPQILRFAAAVIVAGFVTATLWVWLAQPVEVVALPEGRLECLSYTPATDGASPLESVDGTFPVPEGLIAADLEALAPYTDCVRTYSMLGAQGDVLPAAAAAGIEVLVGIWIGAEDERNELEIERALALADQYPEAVRAIVVGNEVLLRREMTGARLAGIIRSVKERTEHPVTYADIYEFWRRNPEVADAVDIVTLHVLPYWDDPAPVGIDQVQEHVRGIIDRARATFPDKQMQIGEIGWPSVGRTRAAAVPSRVNQARFVREFASQAEAIGLPYNLIEAVDQPWKRAPEGTVGGFWGIFDKDRELKFPLSGPVSEWPAWRMAAGVTAAVALAVLLGALLVGRAAPWPAWIALAVTGPAAGASLWALAVYLEAMAIGWAGLLWSAFLMAIAALGASLLAVQLAGIRLPRPAALATVAGAVRSGRGWTGPVWLGLLHAAVMLSAAVLALSLAVDGRHRDFLQLAYWMPAAAFGLLAWWSPADAAETEGRARPEEGWIAALLVVCAPFCIDRMVNAEAVVWALTCVLLALPWLGHARAEAVRQFRALAPARRAVAGAKAP